MSQPPASGELSIPWSDFQRFIRQLSHDLRNHLNAIELQAALLQELASDNEMKEEVKRLREMSGIISSSLQAVVLAISEPMPHRIPYKAADFMADLQQKAAGASADNVVWEIALGDEELEMDPQLLLQAFLELLQNARQHSLGEGKTVFSAGAEDGRLAIRLTEPKKDFSRTTETWGREPLRAVTRSRYGLGLNRARRVIEAHGGELQAIFDPAKSSLITTVTLPLTTP